MSIESCDPFIDETAEVIYSIENQHINPVSLTDLVVILISIMYQHPKPPHSDSLPAGQIKLPRNCTHIADTLARIATTE